MAKPNMPNAGAIILPVVDTSTNRNPIIGPVQEKDTSDKVNAIRKMLSKPVVDSALLSTALLHFEGKVISNAPEERSGKYHQHQEEENIEDGIGR